MGLPFTTHHGGQIIFGPDGYLYFMMGDGGGNGDPYNLSQNKKSLLGKIMRFDVNHFPSEFSANVPIYLYTLVLCLVVTLFKTPNSMLEFTKQAVCSASPSLFKVGEIRK